MLASFGPFLLSPAFPEVCYKFRKKENCVSFVDQSFVLPTEFIFVFV